MTLFIRTTDDAGGGFGIKKSYMCHAGTKTTEYLNRAKDIFSVFRHNRIHSPNPHFHNSIFKDKK
jgi:hypothetical protein